MKLRKAALTAKEYPANTLLQECIVQKRVSQNIRKLEVLLPGMEKIKTIKTAVSPEEEMPIQIKVADTDYYQQLEGGSIEVTKRKTIVFAIGR